LGLEKHISKGPTLASRDKGKGENKESEGKRIKPLSCLSHRNNRGIKRGCKDGIMPQEEETMQIERRDQPLIAQGLGKGGKREKRD